MRITLALAVLLLFFASQAQGFDKPEGVFKSESGAVLTLSYQGEGMTALELTTESCSYQDDGSKTATVGPHMVAAYDENGQTMFVVFYEKDYAAIYSNLPPFEAACPRPLEAMGLYHKQP